MRLNLTVNVCWIVLLSGGIGSVLGVTNDTKSEHGYLSWSHKLKNDLMLNYDKDLRPVTNPSDTTVVQFGMAVVSLLDVDEAHSAITLHAWLRYSWTDVQLRWEPKDYGNVTLLRIDSTRLWIPDITLYNSVDATDNLSNHMALVYNNGQVLWIPRATLTSRCQFDLTDFPYDQHTCTFKFGSWTFDGFMLDLEFYAGRDNVDLSDYVTHTEWWITGSSAKKYVKRYPCCEEPYPDLTFNVTFKRQPTFYVHFYISPAVVMFLLVPFMFLIEPGSPCKTMLGCTILLGCLLLITAVIVTPTLIDRHIVIMIYYKSIMVLTGICLVVSFFIDSMFNSRIKSSPPVPILKVFIAFGKLVFIDPSEFEEKKTEKKPEENAGDFVDVRATIEGQWKALAVAISRMLFIVLFAIVILVTIALFA